MHANGSYFRLYDGSDLRTYLLVRWLGPDALAVCRAHWGFPVGFLLFWYSVLITVESLSLLDLLVIFAGKGLTSWLSFVVSSVSLSLFHWYPGSGVVLDCIDS